MKNLKKLLPVSLLAVLVLSVGVAATSPGNSGNTGRYFVKSDNPFVKAFTGVRHDFPDGFSAQLTSGQVELLNALRIKTEQVQSYHILPKPGCECDNDGVCESGEHPSCCDDCKGGEEEEEAPARECYPSDQTPWGIEKVYNDSTITSTSGGVGVDVAVLDTGVYRDHLDLTGRVEQCKDFTKGPHVKNGCNDKNGHGTHVSGTVLADAGSDGAGIYGVAPEADLFAYRVCGNDGSCWTDDIAAAIDYAGDHEAEIVSMSLGGDSQSSLIKDAIDRNSHVLFVAAAGNDGPEEGSIDYPGAYVKVIATGAIDSAEQVPDWSSRGVNDGDYVIEEKEVEFGTPGVSVESTWNDECYYVADGTSMATPHVSGLAAKLWRGNANDTRSYLQSIAEDIWTSGDDPATGIGLPTVG